MLIAIAALAFAQVLATDASGLTSDEQKALYSACLSARSQGAAAYDRCASREIAALAGLPKPDESGLTSDEVPGQGDLWG